MNYAFFVRSRQGYRDLLQNVGCSFDGQSAELLDDFAKRFTLDEIHHQEWTSFRRHTKVRYIYRVRIVNAACCSRFKLKSLKNLLVQCQVWSQHFNGNDFAHQDV